MEVRSATAAECSSGGVVLVNNGQTFPVCDGDDVGVQGEPGPPGATGPVGPAGPAGPPGSSAAATAPDIVADTLLCQSNDGTTFLTAYIWIMTDGDSVGFCTITEVGTQWSSTAPLIFTSCTLESVVQQGLVTIDFAVNPPALGGVFTGNMVCL